MYINREGVSGPDGSPLPPTIFAAGVVLCIDGAMAWTLGVSSLITEKSTAFCP
jgi:hypothetical protein